MREPCSWQGCRLLSVEALRGVHLIYDGRSFTKERVPLCGEHLVEAALKKRCDLRPEFLFAKDLG
jgi:hypothetical protein